MTKNKIFKFNNERYAENFAYGAVKPMRIILGDDGKYWVVTPADAERLYRAGYSYR